MYVTMYLTQDSHKSSTIGTCLIASTWYSCTRMIATCRLAQRAVEPSSRLRLLLLLQTRQKLLQSLNHSIGAALFNSQRAAVWT